MTAQENGTYLTTAQAAEALGYSHPGMIATACSHGYLPCDRIPHAGPTGYRWLVPSESVLTVLQSMRLATWRQDLHTWLEAAKDRPAPALVHGVERPDDV